MTDLQLEAKLRALRPAELSPAARLNLERALQTRATTGCSHPRAAVVRAGGPVRGADAGNTVLQLLRCFAWSVGGAMALAALIVGFRGSIERASITAERIAPQPSRLSEGWEPLQPLQTSRALLRAEEDYFVYRDAEDFSRRVRLLFLERHTWTDEASGALVAVEVPREDVLFVPVAMQ